MHRLQDLSEVQSNQHDVPLPQQLMLDGVIQRLCVVDQLPQLQYLLQYQIQMCSRYYLNHDQLSLEHQLPLRLMNQAWWQHLMCPHHRSQLVHPLLLLLNSLLSSQRHHRF